MKRTLLIIATVISTILLANCSDSPNTPTIPTEIEENETGNTEHLTHLDNVKDEADAPPPERIIDVDEIVGSNNIELDRILGKPIEVIQSNPIQEITLETRFYQLPDGSGIVFILMNDVIIITTIHYKQGYPTSMQAVKASGFKENQVELVEHIPQKVVPGAVASAQDIYSAVTDNREYEYISVAQNSKSIWDIIEIREKIRIQGK